MMLRDICSLSIYRNISIHGQVEYTLFQTIKMLLSTVISNILIFNRQIMLRGINSQSIYRNVTIHENIKY